MPDDSGPLQTQRKKRKKSHASAVAEPSTTVTSEAALERPQAGPAYEASARRHDEGVR